MHTTVLVIVAGIVTLVIVYYSSHIRRITNVTSVLTTSVRYLLLVIAR